MDNYLKVSEKLYQLRRFLEKSQGDKFERDLYLGMKEMEDAVGIHQCYECGQYSFTSKMQLEYIGGTADFICVFCQD